MYATRVEKVIPRQTKHYYRTQPGITVMKKDNSTAFMVEITCPEDSFQCECYDQTTDRFTPPTFQHQTLLLCQVCKRYKHDANSELTNCSHVKTPAVQLTNRHVSVESKLADNVSRNVRLDGLLCLTLCRFQQPIKLLRIKLLNTQ